MNCQLVVPDVQVSVRGAVPVESVPYAKEKIGHAVRFAPEPVLSVRVRIGDSKAIYPRVLAQANVDVNGRLVRAQVSGSTATEAIDLLSDRLRRQLGAMARRWQGHRRGQHAAVPHDRRHEPARRAGHSSRPDEQRRVVRGKSFTLARCTVDEAAFEMNLMDYEFHLFTEVNTGQDSVLYRGEDADYRLAQVDPRSAAVGPTSLALTVDELPAARMTTAQAERRLELSGQPFVFFVEAELGRGCVLYHRHDGDYGLITPVDARGPADAGTLVLWPEESQP